MSKFIFSVILQSFLTLENVMSELCAMQFIPFNNPLSCVCLCVCVYMFLKYHLSNTLPLMLDFFCIIRTDDYFCAFFFLCCVSAHYERYHNHRALIYSSITHLSLSLSCHWSSQLGMSLLFWKTVLCLPHSLGNFVSTT